MRLLGTVNRWFLLLGLPVLRRIPFLRDLPFVHGYFWIRRLDIPATDRLTLCRAVNRDTVAFMGPNHPEFGTDWMVDKEISTIVAPRMASWAAGSIVAGAPRFWSMNNLVANDGGDSAKDYSVRCAIAGEGVLLHPEGSVHWTNDHVHPLFPGIAQMAIDAAHRTERPVFIVPLVWKYRYTGDVSARLHREMRLIERGLGLPRTGGTSVATHFHALQLAVLAARIRRFDYRDDCADDPFFDRQLSFQRYLLDRLRWSYKIDSSCEPDQRIARVTKEIRRQLRGARHDRSATGGVTREQLREHLAMADECKRLGEFSREVYGSATLTQEQTGESLKRLRDRLLTRGWRNALAKMVPRPLGPRVVHVGVPEPIRVARVEPDDVRRYERELLELTRARMQAKLDEVNRRIEADVEVYRCVNPFV